MSERPSTIMNEPGPSTRSNKQSILVTQNDKENPVVRDVNKERKRRRQPGNGRQQLKEIQTPVGQTLITSYCVDPCKRKPRERTKHPRSTTPCRSPSPLPRNISSQQGWQFPSNEVSSPNQLSTSPRLDQQAVDKKPQRKRRRSSDDGYESIPVTTSNTEGEISHGIANIQYSEPASEGVPCEDSTCPPLVNEALPRVSGQCSSGESQQLRIRGEQKSLNPQAEACLPSPIAESEKNLTLISLSNQSSDCVDMIDNEPPRKRRCLSDYDRPVTPTETEVGTSQGIANLPNVYVQDSELLDNASENIPCEDSTQQIYVGNCPPSVSETLPRGHHSGTEPRQLKFKRTHSNTAFLSLEREKYDDEHSRASNNKLCLPKAKFGESGLRKVKGKRLKHSPKRVVKNKSAETSKSQITLVMLTQMSSSTCHSGANSNSTSEATYSIPSEIPPHTPPPTPPAFPPVSSIHNANTGGGGDVRTTESRNQPGTKKKRRRRCGKCSSCLTPDCGKCPNCLDKKSAKKHRKQACQKKPMCIKWKESEYEEAIRLGYVVIEATKLTFSGVPGSGKTTVRSLILDEILPLKRSSTPVATKATQATIVAVDQEQWHKVNRQEILEMIMDQLEDKRYEKERTSGACSATTDVNHYRGKGIKNESNQCLLSQRLRTILNDHQQRRRKGKKLQLNKMIYLVDIGGQPQLQEVVPLVVRNASVNLLVHKLSDKLSAKPKNEWYNDGKCIIEPEEMDITNIQYLENAARSVFLSKPKLDIKQAISVPDKPSVVLIGTHKDLEHECSESLDKKEVILEAKPIFNHHLKENHIKCIRGKLILDIDGSESGYASEENIAKLKKLRNALLTHGSKLKVKVPIAWYLLLLDIQTESDSSDFISLKKCYELGKNWEISNESVDAALQFFDELNLILYFPSSCSNVVFCNPEFLLQKLTDMILTSVTVPDVDDLPGSRKIFREQGIFTRDLFETPTFQEGFSPLFSLDDFLLLLQDLPIIAKISIDKDKEKYFMPCALSFKRSSEFSAGSPSSKCPVDPLVIIFPKGCSPTGLFCATIVRLIRSYRDDLSKVKWTITPTENLKRKRNVIEFQICDTRSSQSHYDNTLGTVILEDTSDSFIIRTTVDRKYCHELCNVLNSVLETAIEDLSYNADRIDFVFGVQCTMCTGKKAHFASIGPDNTWRCDQNCRKKALTERQRPWFEKQKDDEEGGITEQYDMDGLASLSLGVQTIARIPKFPTEIWKLETLHNRGLTGEGTTIAILDGGIDSSHSSLREKFNQGLIDGFNFVSNSTADWHGPNARDCHGTAVAAAAGGRAFTVNDNNGIIPHGIAPNAELYICRVFLNNQSYNLPVALQHILDLKRNTQKQIDVLCMSFKLPGKDENIESLLSQLSSEGVVCVAAAGNEGNLQKGVTFPASDPHVLSVGALKPLGQMSDLNPYDKIDVYAPGEDLVFPSLENQSSVTMYDGTSFSTPMVAGFLSLLIQCVNVYCKEHYPNDAISTPMDTSTSTDAANTSNDTTSTSKIVSKYHDVKFIKELFNSHTLCDKRKLLRVPEFLSDICISGKLDLVSLIQEIYPDFSP